MTPESLAKRKLAGVTWEDAEGDRDGARSSRPSGHDIYLGPRGQRRTVSFRTRSSDLDASVAFDLQWEHTYFGNPTAKYRAPVS